MAVSCMKLSQRQVDALGHIVDHCRKASELVARMGTRENLESHWEVQYTLIRCIEVIGEASTRLGPDFHGEHPEMPWKLITGMRNRLIHGYDDVNVKRFWDTAAADVPVLLPAVEAIMRAETSGDNFSIPPTL